MDDIDFIRPRVKALLDRSEEIYEAVPGPTNDFDTWSALKLILHSASITTYTKVHNNQGTGDVFYIDALAGSGLSEYEGGHFLGSALLASRASVMPFSKMFFIEDKENLASVLKRRLEYAFDLPEFKEPEEWQVYTEDANEKIPEIVDEIKEISDYDSKFNYYCFIDNQATDVDWPAIEELTPKPYGDLLINIPLAQTIGRNINKEETGELNKFYGRDLSDVTIRHNVRNSARNIYLNQLAERNRPKQVVTRVQAGAGSYQYDLAYVSRRTKNDNPWMDAIRYVRDFIENFHGGDIDRILDVIQGEQHTLEQYLPDDPIGEEAKEELEEMGEDYSQTGLRDFG